MYQAYPEISALAAITPLQNPSDLQDKIVVSTLTHTLTDSLEIGEFTILQFIARKRLVRAVWKIPASIESHTTAINWSVVV